MRNLFEITFWFSLIVKFAHNKKKTNSIKYHQIDLSKWKHRFTQTDVIGNWWPIAYQIPSSFVIITDESGEKNQSITSHQTWVKWWWAAISIKIRCNWPKSMSVVIYLKKKNMQLTHTHAFSIANFSLHVHCICVNGYYYWGMILMFSVKLVKCGVNRSLFLSVHCNSALKH